MVLQEEEEDIRISHIVMRVCVKVGNVSTEQFLKTVSSEKARFLNKYPEQTR